MSKSIMNHHHEIPNEIEVQPTDKVKRLENHILAESFKMGDLDIDKVKRFGKELEMMR